MAEMNDALSKLADIARDFDSYSPLAQIKTSSSKIKMGAKRR